MDNKRSKTDSKREKRCGNIKKTKSKRKTKEEFVIINDSRYYKVKNITCEYCYQTNINGWKWRPNSIPFPETKLIRCDRCFSERFNL